VFDLRTRTFLTSGLLALSTVYGSAPAVADPVQILSLQTGHSIIINADGLSRVAVGDGRIAGVVPIGTSQIVVNGKAPGHTTIFVWTDAGRTRTTYEVTVSSQGLDDIARTLRAAIDEPNVQVVTFNYNIIIRGQVPDIAAYNRIDSIVKRFSGIKFTETGGGGNSSIINAVSVAQPLGSLQSDIAAVPGAHGLRVDQDATGNIIVSGTVHDRADEENVLDRVRGLAGPYLSADGKVIDRLTTDTTSQVDIKVYVLEVDRTATSQIGLRLQSASTGGTGTGTTVGGTQFQISNTPSFIGIENPISGVFGRALNVGNIARASYLAPTLDLLLQEGHAKLLSSPDLVTLPGKEANFLVGGQIPIPQSNGLGTVTISYKDFGVQLKVTPTVLGNGSIETVVAPEISDLDFADGVTLNGFTVPAFKTSKLSTDVITQSGESIVMGGLLRRIESKNIQKIPLLADIPILGQLFRSTSYQRSDSDVVFIMTPTVVTR
jgi:Flp pilus assembly secretin CpaC